MKKMEEQQLKSILLEMIKESDSSEQKKDEKNFTGRKSNDPNQALK